MADMICHKVYEFLMSILNTVISTRVEIGKTINCVAGGVFSHNFEFFQFPRVLT